MIPSFIEAEFDCLNPVQTSAADMDPKELKREFGKDIVFWGGGIDTQKTLPFGSPRDIEKEVSERMKIFGPEGGFVFSAVHNIQSKVPPDNLKAFVEAVRKSRS
jgi:uroporphyrinogen-III decarboxylase